MKNPLGKRVISLIPVCAGVLIVIEIILTNQLAGGGSQMRSVDSAIDDLRQVNALLTQQVASASSLTTIAAKAAEYGFIDPLKSQFLTVAAELPVALNNTR